ncbi:predicted ORF [Xanthomonas phage XacN1]|nr:predicted ORF [Xanthomonas phage XacN1]
MCMKFLYPWQKIPRWSITGKTVYKVMKKSKRDPNICFSVHREHPYTIGEMQHSIIDTDYAGDVTYGLHSFVHLSDAINELNRERRHEYFYGERPESRIAIYECRIPRGARYYRGVWEYHWPDKLIPNIVSNKLVLVKELPLAEDEARLKAWDEAQARKAASAEKEIPSDLAM